MTVVKKIFGRLPVLVGEYDSTKTYGRKNRVTLYGSEFESLIEDNNTAPATWDGYDTISFNTTGWRVVSNGSDAWLASQDKPYDPENFSGLGAIILKRNVQEVEVDGETVKVNVLTQEMMSQANTRYVIKYDFSLRGVQIEVPEGCILEFQGGSISDGIVFSNKTILLGKVEMEKWFGAFKDGFGTWLDQELKPFSVSIGWDFAISSAEHDSVFTGNQSVAMDKNYIYFFNTFPNDVKKEPNIIILVTDHYYNTVGMTQINYNAHANGCTVMDGYIYVPGRTTAGLYKVSTETVVANAMNNNAPTTTGEIVFEDMHIQNISYDINNDMYDLDINGTYDGVTVSRTPYIFRKDGSLVTKFEETDWYTDNNKRTGNQQSCLVNGILYRIDIADNGRNYLVAVDCQSKEVILRQYLIPANNEAEGIFYQDGVFTITFNYSSLDVFKMITHQGELNVTENRYAKVSSQHVIYVDNTTTNIVQTGMNVTPFKHIHTAVRLAAILGDKANTISIAGSEISYKVKSSIHSDRLSIIGTGDTKPIISGYFKCLHNGKLYFENLEFDGTDYNEESIISNIDHISITLYGCDFHNKKYCITSNNGDFQFLYCTIKDCVACFYTNNTNSIILNFEAQMLSVVNCEKFFNYLLSYGICNLYGFNGDSENCSFNARNLHIYTLTNNASDIILNCMANKNVVFPAIDDTATLHILNSNNTAGKTLGFTYNKGDYKIFYWNGQTFNADVLYSSTQNGFLFRKRSELEKADENVLKLFHTGLYRYHSLYEDSQPSYIKFYNEDGKTKWKIIDSVGYNLVDKSGTKRPAFETNTNVGATFFDTTLGKPIYWTGEKWVDSSGADVDTTEAEAE